MKRHTYHGALVPAWLPCCVAEGWIDRRTHGLLWPEQLYRSPLSKRVGWRIGWMAAFLTGAPPRTRRAQRDQGGQ